MNSHPPLALDVPSFGAARQRRGRIGAGIAVSLVVHALLLFAYRQHRAPMPDTSRAPHFIAVWLRPAAAPPPAPPPQAKREPPRTSRPTRGAPAPVTPTAAPTELIAMPTPPAAPAPDLFAVPAPPRTPEGTPRFDREAARRAARQLANLGDPARAGTAVAQLDPPPGYQGPTETKLARDIASAKRPACKDGVPGGLLAPLLLLLDKKDSGCKF